MKVVDLELPESGLVIIDCANEKILTSIPAHMNSFGKARLPQRVLLIRESKKKWRHMILKKNEFVCSLKSLKDMLALVAKGDDSNFWLK
ncbi:hypothetical protein ACOZ07_000825 [Cronobacter dublinensis]